MKCCPTLIHTYRCCEIIAECSKDGNFCIYSSNSFLLENNVQSSVESNKHQEVLKANVQDYLVIADSFLETIGFTFIIFKHWDKVNSLYIINILSCLK